MWRSFAGSYQVMSLTAALTLVSSSARADVTWTLPAGQSGDWSVASNWGGTVPTIKDNAEVENGGTANITSAGASCFNLYVGGTKTGSIQMSAGSLLLQSAEYISNGTFTQTGGTNNPGYYGGIYLGDSSRSLGAYYLGGSGLLSCTSEYVGLNGGGTFAHSGGTNSASNIWLGYYSGSSGSYNLSGSGFLFAQNEYVGGAGTFTQSGGTNSVVGTYGLIVGSAYNGYQTGPLGTYNLNGAALLTAAYEDVGNSASGVFTQSSGTNIVTLSIALGFTSGSGTYTLGGSGLLSAGTEYVGESGTGVFIQTGGTNNVAVGAYGSTGGLYVGVDSGVGSYSLSGSGILSAQNEYIGSGGVGAMTQLGGRNSMTNLTIAGNYRFASGTLQIAGGSLVNQGVFDATGSTGLLTVSGSAILDLSKAKLLNTGSMSLSLGPNSLLLLPAGFNPATALGNFSIDSSSLIHNVGTPLMVAAGQGFSGVGSIADLVNCQGTISAAANGSINLNGGVSISGSGIVNLGSGTLTLDNALSGMSGGTLMPNTSVVGYSGTGTFTQSGGTHYINYQGGNLYLGYNANSSGSYSLSGTGTLSTTSECIGLNGIGTFTQTGGTNNATSGITLGLRPGSTGSYLLNGTGLVGAEEEVVGSYGIGTFIQSGGTNNLFSYWNGTLYLGLNSGTGTYTLSGSSILQSQTEYIGYSGSGIFNHVSGLNMAGIVSVGSSGRYQFGGGTLQIVAGGGFVSQGVFDATGSAGLLDVTGSAIIDFSQRLPINSGSMSLSIGPNSLLIVPPGFDPAAAFGNYYLAPTSVFHTVGTPLVISSGQTITGNATLTDFVDCQGTIRPGAYGSIKLNGGVSVSGTGFVYLGNGAVTVENSISKITSGSLLEYRFYVGSSGTGAFSQSGGFNRLTGSADPVTGYGPFYLGYNPESSGTYVLTRRVTLVAR